MSNKSPILFNVNHKGARLLKYVPKHARAEDSPKGCELQFRNVRIRPNSAAAALLAEGGADEIIESFFKGDSHTSKFYGGGDFIAVYDFKGKHRMKLDHLPARRIDLVNKIRIRFEGGPDQLIWADFSIYIEDPKDEDTIHYHEQMQRDVELVLDQTADLVDEMLAHARGMAVSTTLPNHELNLDGQAAADAARAKTVGDTLEQQESAAAASTTGRKKAKAK